MRAPSRVIHLSVLAWRVSLRNLASRLFLLDMWLCVFAGRTGTHDHVAGRGQICITSLGPRQTESAHLRETAPDEHLIISSRAFTPASFLSSARPSCSSRTPCSLVATILIALLRPPAVSPTALFKQAGSVHGDCKFIASTLSVVSTLDGPTTSSRPGMIHERTVGQASPKFGTGPTRRDSTGHGEPMQFIMEGARRLHRKTHVVR